MPEWQGPKDAYSTVGIDLGINTLATVSDGTTYISPKPLKKYLSKVKRLHRSVSRKKSIKKLAKLYYKISNIRKDTLNKLTTKLAKTKRVICIEDLSVSNMMKNRKLSRSISDLGFYEFRKQLEYKCIWYNCKLIIVNRFYPSSKTCNNCKSINKVLTLSEREWNCPTCNTLLHRDFNASKNLESLAYNVENVAVSSTDTLNAYEVSEVMISGITTNETSLNAIGMK